MDALDRIAGPARDLLARVDDTLVTAGAPADDPLWTLLRRVGALPGEAADAVLALRPEPLAAAAAELRALAGEYAGERAGATADAAWTGSAARAYVARWRDLTGYLGTTADPNAASLAGRLAATGAYLAEIADWTAATRRELAVALAAVLGSAEAVRVRSPASGGFGDPAAETVVAAAAIGARVLDAAARAYDDGRVLCDRWADRLGELPYRPAVDPGATHVGGTTAVPHR